jgi:hypothetical protein
MAMASVYGQCSRIKAHELETRNLKLEPGTASAIRNFGFRILDAGFVRFRNFRFLLPAAARQTLVGPSALLTKTGRQISSVRILYSFLSMIYPQTAGKRLLECSLPSPDRPVIRRNNGRHYGDG